MNKITGEIRWKYHTVDDSIPTGFNDANTQNFGPSGVPVWSSPTIDEKRRRVYIGTGQNYSPPATLMSDSIISIDIESGKRVWSFQSYKDDIWNGSCVRDRVNCDFDIGSNFDFGASPLLISDKNKGDLIIAGQKSGMLYAIDPDEGSVVWKKRVGKGGEHGGVHWSLSSDGRKIFVPIGDIGNHPKAIGERKSGIHAFDAFWEVGIGPKWIKMESKVAFGVKIHAFGAFWIIKIGQKWVKMESKIAFGMKMHAFGAF